MPRENYPFAFMAFISLSLRLSALAFCSDNTAHTAAGIHPTSVICKMRQIIPVSNFPRIKNERNGKKIAISVMVKACWVFTSFKLR